MPATAVTAYTARLHVHRDMRRILLTLGLLLASHAAHAACSPPITAGMTSSQVQTALNSCTSGSTAQFPAGSYRFSSTISVPCGVSLSGPVVPLAPYTGGDGYIREGYAPTAIISATAYPVLSYGTCSTAASLEYLEVNLNRPTNGGNVVYGAAAGGVSNLTISYNYFHGNNWNGRGECFGCILILFDGSASATTDSGDTVSWNRLGANGDCAGVMGTFSYPGYIDDGGYCTAIGWHTNMANMTMNNNSIYYQEEGIKGFEGNWTCPSCQISYNDFSNWHRIAIETQINGTGTTSISYVGNSMHDPYTPGSGTFGLSTAGCATNTNPSTDNCTTIDNSNVVIDNIAYQSGSPNPWVGLGIEFWSADSASTGNNNLIQGEWANSFMISTDGALTANNNHIQSSFGAGRFNTPANCYPGLPGPFGWWNTERSPANTPRGSGNQCDFFDGSVQTSAAATISPASGNFRGSQVVTFRDPGFTSGVGPQGNTGIWYTTDGSTPVPGSGTAKYISTGGTITVTTTTTVKAVGMWGAANQPASYPTGPLSGTFGYQASAVATATYISGTPRRPPRPASLLGPAPTPGRSQSPSPAPPQAPLHWSEQAQSLPDGSSALRGAGAQRATRVASRPGSVGQRWTHLKEHPTTSSFETMAHSSLRGAFWLCAFRTTMTLTGRWQQVPGNRAAAPVLLRIPRTNFSI